MRYKVQYYPPYESRVQNFLNLLTTERVYNNTLTNKSYGKQYPRCVIVR